MHLWQTDAKHRFDVAKFNFISSLINHSGAYAFCVRTNRP